MKLYLDKASSDEYLLFIDAKTSKALVRWNIVFNTYLSVVINYGLLYRLQSN